MSIEIIERRRRDFDVGDAGVSRRIPQQLHLFRLVLDQHDPAVRGRDGLAIHPGRRNLSGTVGVVAIQGTMQVAIFVVMAKFATGL